jgi:hypothetical protein
MLVIGYMGFELPPLVDSHGDVRLDGFSVVRVMMSAEKQLTRIRKAR